MESKHRLEPFQGSLGVSGLGCPPTDLPLGATFYHCVFWGFSMSFAAISSFSSVSLMTRLGFGFLVALLVAGFGCVTVQVPGGEQAVGNNPASGDDDDDDDTGLGSVASCAGSYDGNYSGALNGGVDGYLDTDGYFELDFVVEGDVMSGSGQVSSSGKLVGSSSGLIAIDGQIDLSDCSATGNWSSNYAGSGSWTALPY
jgi:hypothetical protein